MRSSDSILTPSTGKGKKACNAGRCDRGKPGEGQDSEKGELPKKDISGQKEMSQTVPAGTRIVNKSCASEAWEGKNIHKLMHTEGRGREPALEVKSATTAKDLADPI